MGYPCQTLASHQSKPDVGLLYKNSTDVQLYNGTDKSRVKEEWWGRMVGNVKLQKQFNKMGWKKREMRLFLVLVVFLIGCLTTEKIGDYLAESTQQVWLTRHKTQKT